MNLKRICSLFCVLSALCSAYAQKLNGSWHGALDVGGQKLELIFKFKELNGERICTMDVPQQSLKDFQMHIAQLNDTLVELQAMPLKASFKGKIQDTERIQGVWSQSGLDLPLELTPGTSDEVNRPQTPREPLGYQTQEIAFQNTQDDVWLSGTLTYPVNYDPKKDYPVVLFVSGSGSQNRDEEIYEHKPFFVLADYLARNGIASLRYDDRGTGRSTGVLTTCTTEDFTRDAQAGIEYLRKQYPFKRIGIIGHSEGGTIAFRLAAENAVDFIVSMAGTGIKGDTLLTEQLNAIRRLSGQPSGAPDLTIETMKASLGPQQNTLWMKWFLEYDPAPTIASVKIPVMAINGSKDMQVLAESNLTAIRNLLKENPSGQNLIKEYPGLNHLFQHCQIGSPAEYYQIEETIAPEVMQDIAEWINRLH